MPAWRAALPSGIAMKYPKSHTEELRAMGLQPEMENAARECGAPRGKKPHAGWKVHE
jgi:hypothetical protein